MAREYTNRAGRLPWAAALIAARPGRMRYRRDARGERPDVATPGMIRTRRASLFRGAIRDFTVAYAGLDNFLLSTAVITDELHSTGTFDAHRHGPPTAPIGERQHVGRGYNELHWPGALCATPPPAWRSSKGRTPSSGS